MIPRHNDFRSTSRQSPSSKYQSIFFGYCYSCTNFGHMAKDCRAYHKDKYNSPHQLPRSNFARINHASSSMYKMECFKCHNIGHMAHNCNLTWVPSKKRKLHEYGQGSNLDQKASWTLKISTHVVDLMSTSLADMIFQVFDDEILPKRRPCVLLGGACDSRLLLQMLFEKS